MNRKSFEIYEKTKERESLLWKNAIFVFDTSALLDFYFYPIESRNQIFEKIFKVLKERLWIPSHVEYEYLKNRESQIEKPISEKYNVLRDGKIKDLTTYKTKLLKTLEDISKETSKSNSHPILPQREIDLFKKKAKVFSDTTEKLTIHINSEIEKKEKEIHSLKENDTILEAFEKYLTVGESSSFKEILDLIEEGEFRYKHKIPPGYLDQRDKVGTQIFGDLIVWNQILEYAKEKDSDIIFICNDLKADWCYTDNRNRIVKPREELIKEFFDNNGKEFWMYNQSQFLYEANKQLKSDIEESKIDQISKVIADRIKYDLGFNCGTCGMENIVDLEDHPPYLHQINSSHKDGIKVNICQATHDLDCQYCKCDISIDYVIILTDDKNVIHSNISSMDAEITDVPNFVDSFLNNEFEVIESTDQFDFDLYRNR